jgi:hypothetical protein
VDGARRRAVLDQSLVTVWEVPPLCVQVTTPFGATLTICGVNALSVMLTAVLAGEPLLTCTVPVIPPWKLQW